MGCHFLLQGVLPTQESNPGLLHVRQILEYGANWGPCYKDVGFPGGSAGKESACNAGDLGLIPSWEDPQM